MGSIPIGLQLFSVRGEVQKDLPATLKAVAEIGYVGAEPWGYGGDKLEWMGHSPAGHPPDVRRQRPDLLRHPPATDALMGDNLARTVELNSILGNHFLVIAIDPQRITTVDGVAELAGILNDAAEKVADKGMYVGYHAHGVDFQDVEGQTGWERLFSSTRQEVIMQMDIGNCANGGGDPIAMLKKFPNRARSLHLKDYGGGPDSVIGEGKADWETIFKLVDECQNTEWFVVEEGGKDGLGFDICKRSLEALRKMGK